LVSAAEIEICASEAHYKMIPSILHGARSLCADIRTELPH